MIGTIPGHKKLKYKLLLSVLLQHNCAFATQMCFCNTSVLFRVARFQRASGCFLSGGESGVFTFLHLSLPTEAL